MPRQDEDIRALALKIARQVLVDGLRDEAEFVASEVELRVHNRLSRTELAEIQNLGPFVWRTTIRVCSSLTGSRTAKERLSARFDEHTFADEGYYTASVQEELTSARQVLDAVEKRLDERQRVVLRDCLEGYTHEEIASRRSLTVNQVRYAYEIALKEAEKHSRHSFVLLLYQALTQWRNERSPTRMTRKMMALAGAAMLCSDLAPAVTPRTATTWTKADDHQQALAMSAQNAPSGEELLGARDAVASPLRLTSSGFNPFPAIFPTARNNRLTISDALADRLRVRSPQVIEEQWHAFSSSRVVFLGVGRYPTMPESCEECSSLQWSHEANGIFYLVSSMQSVLGLTDTESRCISAENVAVGFSCMGARVSDAVVMECHQHIAICNQLLPSGDEYQTLLLVGRLRGSSWLVGNSWNIYYRHRGGVTLALGNATSNGPFALRTTSVQSTCTPNVPGETYESQAGYFMPMDPLAVLGQVCDIYPYSPPCFLRPFRFLRTHRSSSSEPSVEVEIVSDEPWEGSIVAMDGEDIFQQCTREPCHIPLERVSQSGFIGFASNEGGLTLLAPQLAPPEDPVAPIRFAPSTELRAGWWCGEGEGTLRTIRTEEDLDAVFSR